eukprot:jgi/Psemu1/27771/gm1.27771_g
MDNDANADNNTDAVSTMGNDTRNVVTQQETTQEDFENGAQDNDDTDADVANNDVDVDAHSRSQDVFYYKDGTAVQ